MFELDNNDYSELITDYFFLAFLLNPSNSKLIKGLSFRFKKVRSFLLLDWLFWLVPWFTVEELLVEADPRPRFLLAAKRRSVGGMM